MSEKFPLSQEPFKSDLLDTEMGDRIKTLKEDRSVIVKTYELRFTPEKMRQDFLLKEELKDEMERRNAAREIFERLRTEYGIPMADFQTFVGEHNGKVCFYTISKKIEGCSIAEMDKLPFEARNKLDALYAGLARYFGDVFRTGGKYWYDILFGNKQFVYGHESGKEEEKPYLVDFDPNINVFDIEVSNKGYNHVFFILFQIILDMISEAEKKFPDGGKLEGARTELRDQLQRIGIDVPGGEVIRNLLGQV